MPYLFDSNVVINYVAENYDSTTLLKLDTAFDTAFNYSVITFMEVMGFNIDSNVEEKFEKLFNSGKRQDIDDLVMAATINMRKTIKIKLPDAIIAATAIAHNLELLTENTTDFIKVPNLKVLDPDYLP